MGENTEWEKGARSLGNLINTLLGPLMKVDDNNVENIKMKLGKVSYLVLDWLNGHCDEVRKSKYMTYFPGGSVDKANAMNVKSLCFAISDYKNTLLNNSLATIKQVYDDLNKFMDRKCKSLISKQLHAPNREKTIEAITNTLQFARKNLNWIYLHKEIKDLIRGFGEKIGKYHIYLYALKKIQLKDNKSFDSSKELVQFYKNILDRYIKYDQCNNEFSDFKKNYYLDTMDGRKDLKMYLQKAINK